MNVFSVLVLLFALVGLLVCQALDVGLWAADWWRVRQGRRRVHAALERETARHIGNLVPDQREPSDPVWWEFVPTQRNGDDHDR